MLLRMMEDVIPILDIPQIDTLVDLARNWIWIPINGSRFFSTCLDFIKKVEKVLKNNLEISTFQNRPSTFLNLKWTLWKNKLEKKV